MPQGLSGSLQSHTPRLPGESSGGDAGTQARRRGRSTMGYAEEGDALRGVYHEASMGGSPDLSLVAVQLPG